MNMEIGRLAEIDFTSPIIHSSYNSITRKSQSIAYKLETILTACIDIKSTINEHDNIYIAGEIGDFFEKMYSCMEYTASILKELFRDKGTLQASYHDILKKIIKNEDSTKFLSDRVLVNFAEGTLSWYAIVHDTRSEEAHFTTWIPANS
ncbi:MAG: hypothetical protein KGZ50_08885 [Peptococcaceae bacterium]|nr:hypothetical protein [Peptococcaceae bacterium]